MMWWIFNAAAAALDAQAKAFQQLPPDSTSDGRTSQVQYTKRWDLVASLKDGTFAFRSKPGMDLAVPTKTNDQVILLIAGYLYMTASEIIAALGFTPKRNFASDLVADGTTDNATAIAALSSTPFTLLELPPGSISTSQPLAIPDKSGVEGTQLSAVVSSGNVVATVGNKNSYRGGLYYGPQVVFNWANNGSNTSVCDAYVENYAGASAFNLNGPGGQYNVTIRGNAVYAAGGYGILTNAPANIDTFNFSLNTIYATADGIEINAPGKVHKFGVILGNAIDAPNPSANPSIGFGVGIARARYTVVLGNTIRRAGNQGFHFEDEQYGNTLVANVGTKMSDGLRVQQWSTGKGKPFPVVGNNLRGLKGTDVDPEETVGTPSGAGVGIYHVFDGNGSMSLMMHVGNQIRDFDTGFYNGVADQTAFDNNVIEGCTIGMTSFAGSVHGDHFFRGVPTLTQATYGSTAFGKAIATDTPTTLLDVTQRNSNETGSYLRGFEFPVAATVNGATAVAICEQPTLIFGRIRIRCKTSAADHGYYSATIKYDGSTVTVTDALKHVTGTFDIATIPFTITGGKLNFHVTCTTSRATAFNVDFEGEFYKA